MKRSTHKLTRTPPIVALIVTTLLLLGCDTTEQEQEIQSVLDQAVTVVEQGNIKDIFKISTRDFAALPGNLNRSAIIRKLPLVLRNFGALTILHPTPEIEIDETGESAVVNVPFSLVRTGTSYKQLGELIDNPDAWEARAAEEQLEIQHLELSMIKQEENWLIETARFL